MTQNNADDFTNKYAAISARKTSTPIAFYYGVKTTGVFCQPGCPSRLPKPQNVVFFAAVETAMQAGYRPCRKCQPLNKSAHKNSGLIVEVCKIIEESEDEPTLNDLSEQTTYSKSYVQKVFKRSTGISPKEYASAVKTRKFRKELQHGPSVASAVFSAGFGSSSRVYENVDDMLAMTPTQFRNHGAGVDIRMEIFECFPGYVLVAFTDKGVSSVELGDTDVDLAKSFKKQFRNANITSLHSGDRKVVENILTKVVHPSVNVDIPLDIHGTIFQKNVWNALRGIPAGETRTYTEIAEQIGHPKSVRAVANACAKNNIAILIPCHRVLRKDGNLAGYRWGKDRKAKLLQTEREKD